MQSKFYTKLTPQTVLHNFSTVLSNYVSSREVNNYKIRIYIKHRGGNREMFTSIRHLFVSNQGN